MKRYIIEERESTKRNCEGCIFEDMEKCGDMKSITCVKHTSDGVKYVIFVLAKEEEIK